MIAIDNVLISEDIIEKQFLCNLEACKGACCYEGDLGAPVQKQEVPKLEEVYKLIKHTLPVESQKVVDEFGVAKHYKDLAGLGTQLVNGGPCVFMIKDELGIAKCAIEQAYYQGITDFKKPISCHLYPIRVTENTKQGFIALNYDNWEICDPACKAGKKAKLPVYKFLKEAIIRRFGQDFYETLDVYASDQHQKD